MVLAWSANFQIDVDTNSVSDLDANFQSDGQTVLIHCMVLTLTASMPRSVRQSVMLCIEYLVNPAMVGLNIGWDCLSCNALQARMTVMNFHCFSEATDSPLAQP